MAANLKKTVKIKTDSDGRRRITRVHSYDASKARKVAKRKSRRVVSPAKAEAVKPKLVPITIRYLDLTGRTPKTVTETKWV